MKSYLRRLPIENFISNCLEVDKYTLSTRISLLIAIKLASVMFI